MFKDYKFGKKIKNIFYTLRRTPKIFLCDDIQYDHNIFSGDFVLVLSSFSSWELLDTRRMMIGWAGESGKM